MYYVYEIYNDVTQRRYIGLSAKPTKRFQSHLTNLRNHTHTAEGINKDYVQYGEEHFFFRIIDTAKSKEEGLTKERRHIVNNRSYVPEYGYNGNDPRWNRKVPIKAIVDSELKREIKSKGYKISEIPYLLNIRCCEFVNKMNNPKLFTNEEMAILKDLIKNSPTDWWGRHEYAFQVREKRRAAKTHYR